MFVWSENGANKTLLMDILSARMKIMWEEQCIDPPIAVKLSVSLSVTVRLIRTFDLPEQTFNTVVEY